MDILLNYRTDPGRGARGASTKGTGRRKMTATQTETIGVGENLLVEIDNERAILEKGGMNVAVARATVSLAVEEAKAANALQESLKHQLKSATELTEAKMRHAYVVISGTIDMMMGAVQKDTPPAKVFQRFRSKMRQRGDSSVPEPLPVPVQEATK